MENDDVHDCAPVMREGNEDGDVERKHRKMLVWTTVEMRWQQK